MGGAVRKDGTGDKGMGCDGTGRGDGRGTKTIVMGLDGRAWLAGLGWDGWQGYTGWGNPAGLTGLAWLAKLATLAGLGRDTPGRDTPPAQLRGEPDEIRAGGSGKQSY